VLALSDFNKTFIIEANATECGIEAVLMQENHSIAFITRALNKQQQSLSTYERAPGSSIYNLEMETLFVK